MPLEAATSLIRQSVVPGCRFSATTGLPAEAAAVGFGPTPAGAAGSVWRRAAPMYPAPIRTARHATAATRPLRTRAEFVILPAASAAIPDHRGTSLLDGVFPNRPENIGVQRAPARDRQPSPGLRPRRPAPRDRCRMR